MNFQFWNLWLLFNSQKSERIMHFKSKLVCVVMLKVQVELFCDIRFGKHSSRLHEIVYLVVQISGALNLVHYTKLN